MDSDDAITKTALEELYKVAKNFDADVVSCEKYYQTAMNGDIKNFSSLKISSYANTNFVKEPTMITENMVDRINSLYKRKFMWSPWLKLIRREFIMKNNLTMIDAAGQDAVFTCCLVAVAERYFLIPNIVNIYRIHDKSISFRKETPETLIPKWSNSLINGFNYIDKFLSEFEFFKQHIEVKFVVLETIVSEFVKYLVPLYAQFPNWQINSLIYKEFEKNNDTTAITSFLFDRMNVFNVNLIQQQNFIRQQQAQIQQLQTQLQELKNSK